MAALRPEHQDLTALAQRQATDSAFDAGAAALEVLHREETGSPANRLLASWLDSQTGYEHAKFCHRVSPGDASALSTRRVPPARADARTE